jgi:hypothetical protein
MNLDEMGTVKYGNLRFIFNFTGGVKEFLEKEKISLESIFPKTQFFYQGILMKLGINYNDVRELFVVFNGLRIDDFGIIDSLGDNYEKFHNFPIHVGEKIYFAEFGVEVK